MENSTFVGLSRQMALRSQMDVIANNVANMSTPGYRAQNMVFTEYVETPSSRQKHDSLRKHDPLSMVLDYGQYQVTEPGPTQFTGGDLDIALQGPGYIGIEGADGETAYTRAGNFQINELGELITGRGNHVLDQGGGVITIPENSGPVKIGEDGSIATEEGEVAKIMIMEFENLQTLEATGDGLYKATAEGVPAEKTRVIQGMVEGSNVKPVLEMTRMIDVLRSYQQTQRMLQSEHDRQRTMIQRLSRGS